MKQKSKSIPENIRTRLSQNQKINIRDNTHGLVNCNTQNDITQKYSCSRFVASSASDIPGAPVDNVDANSLKANIQQHNSNVTKHGSEIHYATVAPRLQSGPPSFFSPSRRKQSNLLRPLGTSFGASSASTKIHTQNNCVHQHHPVPDSLAQGYTSNTSWLNSLNKLHN